MAKKQNFPIWLKILLAIASVSIVSIVIYLSLAIKLFRDDKASLVYELNRSHVKTLTAEVESELKKIADKVRLLTKGYNDPSWVNAIFDDEDSLVAYSLYRSQMSGRGEKRSTEWKRGAHFVNDSYLKLYNLEKSDLEKVREQYPLPFDQILQSRTLVFNSTLPDGAPLITLAKTLNIAGERDPRVAVVDLRLDSFIKMLQDRGIVDIYLVDSQGKVIAHSDPEKIKQHQSLAENPIVMEALQAAPGLKLTPFEWGKERWIGAYDSVALGNLKVISQVKEAEAFRAAQQLIIKSLLFALLLVTISVFVSQKLARTFTDPLYVLVEATEKLTKWEVPTVEVRSKDEIGSLARAFNSMASDLKAQREQIQRHNEELEQKVRERTADLEAQKKKAAQAQEALLRTTRLATLGELAGSAAHEVLNPVNNMNIRLDRMRSAMLKQEQEDLNVLQEIIKGWSEAFQSGGWENLEKELKKTAQKHPTLLQEDLENLGSIAADSLKRIQDKNQDMDFLKTEMLRIIRIINNMRSLARVGGERKPVRLAEPIDDTMAALGDLFEKHQVTVEKSIQEDVQIIADRDELIQVFSNLIRNSIQAVQSTDQGEPRISISVSKTEKRVEIRFKDNGPGISKENAGRIFEPTFTTKRASEGTGIGLSISRRLVRAFDGDLELEEIGGKTDSEWSGATFLVWFPLKNHSLSSKDQKAS